MATAAYRLEGLSLDGGWVVGQRESLPVDHTGGAFSVGYRVANGKRTAFLKAFDYALAFDEKDPPAALDRLTRSYLAERGLLDWCREQRLHRIVRALDAGTVRVGNDPLSSVSYLIFELADGDARTVVSGADPGDQVPRLLLAHNAAAALKELHGVGISHQDIKPSNLFVWKDKASLQGKLGDLGSAHHCDHPAPHDDRIIAGDAVYAAPEQHYGCQRRLDLPNRRAASDLFMFGNLLAFLLTSVSYSAIFYSELDSSLHWDCWAGTFDEALPALVHSHTSTIERIQECLHSSFAAGVTEILDEVCYPDPLNRGSSPKRTRARGSYGLERYVTRLDLIYRHALIAEKTRRRRQ